MMNLWKRSWPWGKEGALHTLTHTHKEKKTGDDYTHQNAALQKCVLSQQREQNKTASILSALIGNRNCVSLFSLCVCVYMCEPTSPVSHNSQMDAQSFLVLCGTLWGVKGLTVTQNTNTHVNTQRHVQLTQEKLAYTQTHGSAHIQYIAIALFTKFNNLHTHTHTLMDTHTHGLPVGRQCY